MGRLVAVGVYRVGMGDGVIGHIGKQSKANAFSTFSDIEMLRASSRAQPARLTGDQHRSKGFTKWKIAAKLLVFVFSS